MGGKSVTLGIMLGCCIGSSAIAEPLAPLAKGDSTMALIVKPHEREVPDSSEVGIPAYPGSKFCIINKGEWGPDGWSKIKLYSTDSAEKVIAWYQKELDDWHCTELVEGYLTRCSDKDPGAAGFYDPQTFNVVDISANKTPMPCDVPGVQSRIEIRFQPDK